MSTIVISHGYGAGPDSVWFPYLQSTLASAGHATVIPSLPGPVPSLGPWVTTLTNAVGNPAETVLIGHSIGGVNILRLLEHHGGVPFAGVVLVSVPSRDVGYAELAPFFEGGFDWARIRSGARKFRVLAAIDDPVNAPAPESHAIDFVRNLGAAAYLTPAGGHFGASPDEKLDLPQAIRLIEECLTP